MARHVLIDVRRDADGGSFSVPSGGDYHVVSFPCGAAESYDPDDMHAQTRDGKDHPVPAPATR